MDNLDPNRFAASLIVLTSVGPLSGRVPSGLPIVDLQRPRIRQALPALRQALRRDMPDISMSTMGHLNAGLLALKPYLPSSIRYVVREANLPLVGLTGIKRCLQSLAYRRLYRRADAIVCPSRPVMEGVAEAAPKAVDAISIIHNPVDLVQIRENATIPTRVPGAGLRLVAVGRLTHQKGFDRIVSLMDKTPPNTHLTIIGDGPDRPVLERQIAENDLYDRISLAGYMANPWPPIAGADALLLPSRWEGLPNVALEALACGTPVIATPEAGGIDEIAALSPKSVALLPMGPEFVAGIAGLIPGTSLTELKSSLLPPEFFLENILAGYERLFASLVRG